MAIPLAAGLLITGLKPGRLAFLIYLVFVLSTALILTLSRGGWAGLVIGLILMSATLITNRYYRHKGVLTAAIGILFFLSIVSLASTPVRDRILSVSEKTDEPSLNARITVWQATLKMITDHPWSDGPRYFQHGFHPLPASRIPRTFLLRP